LIKAEFYNWSIPEKQYNGLRDRRKIKPLPNITLSCSHRHPPAALKGHEQDSGFSFHGFSRFVPEKSSWQLSPILYVDQL